MADTGADTRLAYLFEDNGFASSPTDTTHKAWGSDAMLDTAEGSNQVRQVLEPGSKQPIDSIVQLFEGRWSVSFNLVNPWWLALVFGDPGSPTNNGDGSYTYSYSGTSPQSARIVQGYENSDKTREFLGCAVTNMRVDTAVNDNIRVVLDGPYAKEVTNDQSGGGGIFTQPSFFSEMETMTFAQGEVKLDGTVKNKAQSASVALPLQAAMVAEIGSRFPVDFYTGPYRPTVDVREIKASGETDDLEKFYGGATTMQDRVTNKLDVVLTFDDSDAAGSGINKVVFTLSDTLSDRYSEGGVGDPEVPIEEQINRTVESISASATNEQSSAP